MCIDVGCVCQVSALLWFVYVCWGQRSKGCRGKECLPTGNGGDVEKSSLNP